MDGQRSRSGRLVPRQIIFEGVKSAFGSVAQSGFRRHYPKMAGQVLVESTASPNDRLDLQP